MDEEFDDLDQEVEEPKEESAPEPASAQPDWEAEVRKLRKENQGLRRKHRRSELEAKYGAEVIELIPEELPISKWDGYAEKLTAHLATKPTQTDQATEEAAEEPPPEDAERLAAVAKGTGSGTAASSKTYDRAEWDELFRNPSTRQEALRAAQEGRVRLNNQAAYDAEVKDREELFVIPR